MYEKMFEQSERLFKPFGDIWALQAQAAETLAKQHGSLMTDAWNQGVQTLQNIPGQKSVEDVFRLQQAYWENMQESWQELFESTQGVILETNRKISALLQESASAAGGATRKSLKPVVSPTAPAKKSAPVKKPAVSAKTTNTKTTSANAAGAKAASRPVAPQPAKAAAASAGGVKTADSGKTADPARAPVKSEAKTDGKAEPLKALPPEAAPKKSDLFV